MSNKLLNHLEDRLKDRRRHLLKEINLRLSFNRSSVCWTADTADIASNLVEHNTIMSIAQSEVREINQIDNALKKIQKGKYGVCECCSSKINKQRLIAIPFVSLCVKCKEAEERNEGIMVNRIETGVCDEFGKVEEEISNGMYDEGCDINQFGN
jgi:DnaK suppressor protein